MRTWMYLVRHGATEANLAKPARLQGQSDVPLAPLGIRQSEVTRDALSHIRFVAAYSSPMGRAMKTAAIIAPYLQVTPIAALGECDVGRWEGLDWDTIRRDDADTYTRYMADPTVQGYPGGESFADVLKRTQPILDALFATHRGSAFLVVSHHVVNRTYLAVTLGLALKAARNVSLDNCGVSVVTQDGEKRRVKVLNSTLHLKDVHIDE